MAEANKNTEAMSLTDMLLCVPTRKRASKTVKVTELSEAAGKPVYFKLKELDYNDCAYLKGKGEDMDAYIVCMGVSEPDLNCNEFSKSQGEAMPQDALKKYLSAGTIESLSREIQKLSGYRTVTVEDVKKK